MMGLDPCLQTREVRAENQLCSRTKLTYTETHLLALSSRGCLRYRGGLGGRREREHDLLKL